MKFRKLAILAFACIAPMSLSGCLILPGEFTSEMRVMKSGDFTFSYKGQIQLLGLANLMNNTIDAEAGAGSEFEATCYVDADSADAKKEDEKASKVEEKKAKKAEKAAEESASNAAAVQSMQKDSKSGAASSTAEEDPELANDSGKKGDAAADAAVEAAATAAAEAAGAAADAMASEDFSMEERDCSPAEIAEQKATWDEEQAAKKKKQEEQKKLFAMMLGGIDPKDPATIKRFTKEVERMAAWKKVEHLGDGLFMIDYSTTGHLQDDFAFPVIPRYSLGEPMIHVTRWDNGRVRVEAPAFHNDPNFSTMAMLGAGNMMGMGAMGGAAKAPKDPVAIKGTFTLTTDAKILANNTEEGPEEAAGGLQILRWDIGPANFGPPMALLKMIQ